MTPTAIRAFVRDGFVAPARGERGEYRFDFQALVLLRTARDLADKIPTRRVRKALKRLQEQLPENRSLRGLHITVVGDEIVVRSDGAAWDAESGQALLDFSVDEMNPALVSDAVNLPDDADPASASAARDLEETLSEADQWYEVGCDLEAENPDEARRAYERAVACDPHHADARVNLGRLLHEGMFTKEAAQQYRIALSVRPHDATAAFNLGVALEDLDRWGGAIEAYKLAIDVDPSNADAHYNLALVYERQGRGADAIRHLKIYRELTGAS